MSAVKCVWRRPAIKVSHEVTLNLSSMNTLASPPVTPIEEAGKFSTAVRELVIEEVVLVLGESVHADLNIVSPDVFVQSRLQAPVIGGLIAWWR